MVFFGEYEVKINDKFSLKPSLRVEFVDKNINKYGGYELSGTTVPYWDDLCGIKVEDIDELEKKYAFFIGNLEKFNPINLVENELTFEVFKENLIKEFRNNF